MSAQLRRSARKRKNLPIVAAASARKKANQRVPDTMSVPAPQLPTVDTGTPFIPVTSSTGTYPMLISQTGAGIYTSASTGPVDLTSTANTLLYSRVPLPDQREYNTVTSQDPPEHSLGNTNGASNFTMPFSTFDHPIQIPSMHANIAFNVSQSIREKIMKSEFIDLGILLANNTQQATQKLVFRGGEFIVQTENLQNKIGSIDQWTSAFIIFVSVYCTVHSGRLQELLKYMSVVRLGAKKNPNNLGWKLYDEQFRLRKALDPASSWAIVDSELWLLYMADSSGTQNLEVVSSGYNTFSANRNVNKKSKCYAFNYNGKCFNSFCQYSHACIQCHGVHSVINCQFKQYNLPSQTRPNSRVRQPYVNSRFSRPGVMSSQNFVFRQQQQTRPRAPGTSMATRAYPNKN
ncbi:Hypothetical predicted protein [Mytilus galloprovincialis]|uniref:C3H1-type domain-containing protein n=1 Tax=Mytilus galloprovincialis TaxID=29158 RepID=A0A8B6BIE2_MYTGA|nr:Hypothetical predicted protein [Mytilus galloprovincialis]